MQLHQCFIETIFVQMENGLRMKKVAERIQRQFVSLSQLRSIETKRDLIIAANTGPSSLISSTGEVKESFSSFEEVISLPSVELAQAKPLLDRKKTKYSNFSQ